MLLVLVCASIGAALQYFAGYYWLTASLITLAALLFNGLVIFNEDLEKGGYDYQEGVTDTPEFRASQRRHNLWQGALIIVVLLVAAWSSI